MITIEKTQIFGWEAAIRGMRNPKNSWDKSDSYEGWWEGPSPINPEDNIRFFAGENDLALMKKLANAGPDHGKFLRMVNVTADITCNQVWWSEFDTYKVGTVRNSCSKMHTIHVKEFVKKDFSTEGIVSLHEEYVWDAFERVLDVLNYLRDKFNETQDKRYWRAMIELLPSGYNMKATVQLNYQVLKNMYHARKYHKLFEWKVFCLWIESLPYSELITGERKANEENTNPV